MIKDRINNKLIRGGIKNMEKKRNYYFDILRIIAMCLIVSHHIAINDFGLQPNLLGTQATLSNPQIYVLILINCIAIIGVNLFFLISGYFKIKISLKKVVSLVIQLYLVYGIVTLIGIVTKNVIYNKDILNTILFPFNLYWFLGAYLGLIFLSPLLNNMIDSTTKKDIKYMIIVLLFFTVYAFRHDNGLLLNGGYSLLWAITLYVTGGLINKFNIKSKFGIVSYFISTFILFIIIVLTYKYNSPQLAWNVYKYNNIFVLISSLSLFIFFNSLKFKIKSKILINTISFFAKNTLMVYLLHSTCWLTIFRRYPTTELLKLGYFKLGIILLPLYVIFIYLVCSIISFIYNITVQNIVNKIFEIIERKRKKALSN